ncbi:hypothetical protein L1765_00810 [Microaerobacter geothermalis]|uniref:hypothetical protein n=1 Tax=Microaerobacter geothermalis TaxID=674972 RepID=UPI001F15F6B2|nr:hypothetical protein [Microaerobacter geothermalis]MCF6092532.1 hypothetical protein [Microaerobacter geothermalis]
MFKIVRIILIIFITLFLSACQNDSVEVKYKVIIFIDKFPSKEIQDKVNNILDSGKIFELDYNMNKPSHIKEFPTIIVIDNKGEELRTNSFEEFFSFFENLTR